MNTFALEIFDDQGGKCTFYAVRWDDSEISETDKFLHKFSKNEKLKSDLQELAKFLEIVIGDEKGALEEFFRAERLAQGLPPKGEHWVNEINFNFFNFPLRLYCLRISDSLVVLFNGGEKTAETAQEGKTSMAFYEANQFAARLLEAIQQKEIYITPKGRYFRNFEGSEEIYL